MLTSYPPAACRASCLCEGGDGADGWEDERKDKKAFRKIKIGVGGTAQGFHRPSGNKHHTFFCSCWICHRNRLWKMSASRQLSESRAIPTKTVLINDTTQLPHDYCTTPGGTLFSTTPGGESMPPLVCFIVISLCRKWRTAWLCVLVWGSLTVSCLCGLKAALSSRSKQKQSLAPPPASSSCCLIGCLAAQRFR